MSIPTAASTKVERFTITVPDEELADLHSRLERTRFPDDYLNDDWSYGTNGDFLRGLVRYWCDEFDWRTVEARMNEYEHFRVAIEDVPLHYMRIPGKGPNPKPVLLSHGWPWTFWDFHRVFGLLSDPAAHGGDERDALELIVPSLPGFGFSSPVHTALGVPDHARILHTLMHDVLGFGRYGAAGGDWGSSISAYLSHGYSRHLIGAHLTEPHLLSMPYEQLTADDYADDERGWYEGNQERKVFSKSHIGVAANDPQTAAVAFNDSPAGLAAWIVERRFHWADCRGDIANVFTMEDLCTTVAIYWFTQTIGSSMRIYADTMRSAGLSTTTIGVATMHDRMPVLEAPTGIAVFPGELVRVPRRVAEQYANLQRWTVLDAGGHFSPFEVPNLYANDVLAFFRDLD
jgi:pimeloyl-ACP methyl ester carboxylesterase